ncbi:MAG: hypothetical protein ACREQ3_26270 [Candidatus Binatia bacterium]
MANYQVTNRNDSGNGSFRDALLQGDRNIYFTVGGDWNLNSPLECKKPNVRIYAHLAPAPGVTLKHYGLHVRTSQAQGIEVYGVRVRDVVANGGDAFMVKEFAHHVVFGWCSAKGAQDGAFDVSQGCSYVQMLYSILAQSNPANGNKGCLFFEGAEQVYLHHCLLTGFQQRNPKAEGPASAATALTVAIVNNVMWDFTLGVRLDNQAHANVIANYLHTAQGTAPGDYLKITNGALGYASGNYSKLGYNVDAMGNQGTPFPGLPVATTSAADAAAAVLASAGVRPLDTVDANLLAAISSVGL